MAEILHTYGNLLFWLSVGSAFLFCGSLAALPWLVGKLPRDYFLTLGSARRTRTRRYLFGAVWLKNVLGFALVFMGFIMLFIPGQGVLTMVAGLVVMEFPGKARLILYLVRYGNIRSGLNWLRKKQGKAPLHFPSDRDS